MRDQGRVETSQRFTFAPPQPIHILHWQGHASPVVALKSLSSSRTSQSRLEASVAVGLTLEGSTRFALVPVECDRYPSCQAACTHAHGRHMAYRQLRTPTQGMRRHCRYSASPSQAVWLLSVSPPCHVTWLALRCSLLLVTPRPCYSLMPV
jgi:hypothetical protein